MIIDILKLNSKNTFDEFNYAYNLLFDETNLPGKLFKS